MKHILRILTLYEAMGGKSLLRGEELTDEDLKRLMHAYVCVGEGAVTQEAFDLVLGNDKVADDIAKKVSGLLDELAKWGELLRGVDNGKEAETDDVETSFTDIVGLLVVECGLSPEYVLDEMGLWEIQMYVGGLNKRTQKRMEEKRLFTFIQVSPWLNTRGKMPKPKDILAFPWEEDAHSRADDDIRFIENNYEQLNDILNGTARKG